MNSPFFAGYDWSAATTENVERIEIVDALPRTGSGKLNRPELRVVVDRDRAANNADAERIDDAEQGDGRHQKAGGNRAPDEGFRDVHCPLPFWPRFARAPRFAPQGLLRRSRRRR